mgnify:CR=1 FL=1
MPPLELISECLIELFAVRHEFTKVISVNLDCIIRFFVAMSIVSRNDCILFSKRYNIVNDINLPVSKKEEHMAEKDNAIALKERLILAGIDEILENGAESLSLRKVASSCGASCAAPYKHFKNKEEFLAAVSAYIEEKWQHLSQQIRGLFSDRGERICELCIANIKFRLANTLYDRGHADFDQGIKQELRELCREDGRLDFDELFFVIASLVCGVERLILNGAFPNEQTTYDMLRLRLKEELLVS